MQAESIASWQHKHVFGQDKISQGERKTLIVIIITTMMMTWEIGAGILSGSMALLADGIHMGSHAVGLGITVTAYFFARKKAADSRFCFGTGKVNALAGYTSALILAFFALSMAWGSIQRLLRPVDIAFNQALWVAMIGLVVNGVSVWILKENPRGIGRENHVHIHGETAHSHADHNLRAAYLHVLADAFTSLTAIAALLSGKFFGLIWLDPITE
jgi:cation diffusion facilitator family transporter